MPEVRFKLRWPDGDVDACYSPSRIIKDFLEVGRDYTLAEFLARSRQGFKAASNRVAEQYGGGGCSMAMAQLAAIEAKAKLQPTDPDVVRVEGFTT